MTSLRFSIDPKPIGAFVEYTLKPILDELNEVLDKLVKLQVSRQDLKDMVIWMYLWDKITYAVVNLTCTSILCYTIYLLLSAYLPTLK